MRTGPNSRSYHVPPADWSFTPSGPSSHWSRFLYGPPVWASDLGLKAGHCCRPRAADASLGAPSATGPQREGSPTRRFPSATGPKRDTIPARHNPSATDPGEASPARLAPMSDNPVTQHRLPNTGDKMPVTRYRARKHQVGKHLVRHASAPMQTETQRRRRTTSRGAAPDHASQQRTLADEIAEQINLAPDGASAPISVVTAADATGHMQRQDAAPCSPRWRLAQADGPNTLPARPGGKPIEGARNPYKLELGSVPETGLGRRRSLVP